MNSAAGKTGKIGKTGMKKKWLLVAIASVLTGGARAVLSPEHIEAEKSSAPYQLTIQIESIERVGQSNTGGLDRGVASGRIIEVTRAPRGASAMQLGAGDSLAFRAPVWAWSDRDREPPGPDRLYWGADAPRDRLEVWGAFDTTGDGGAFVASVFETQAAAASEGAEGPVEAVLDRIDQVAVAFVEASEDDLGRELERITGLSFRSAGSGSGGLRADASLEGGWASVGEFRVAGNSRILTLAVNDSVCVKSSHVYGRHGSDAQPIPIPPTRNLPAPWHLKYERSWGFVSFGFRMAQPQDYDGCLVEVLFRQDI